MSVDKPYDGRLEEIEYRLERGESNIEENVKSIKALISDIRTTQKTISRIDRFVTAFFFATTSRTAAVEAAAKAGLFAAGADWKLAPEAITALGGGEYAISAPATTARLAAAGAVPFLPLILAFVIPAVTEIVEEISRREMVRLERKVAKEMQEIRREIIREVERERAARGDRLRGDMSSVSPGW